MLRTIGNSSSNVAFMASRCDRQRSSNSGGSNKGNSSSEEGRIQVVVIFKKDAWEINGFRENSSTNQQRQNATGGRRPYISRCQICRGEHYVDKFSQFVAARSDMSSANLSQAFHAACNVSDSTPDWYLDSGASTHMTNQTTALDSFESYTGNSSIIVGNRSALNISYIGSSKLSGDVHYWTC